MLTKSVISFEIIIQNTSCSPKIFPIVEFFHFWNRFFWILNPSISTVSSTIWCLFDYFLIDHRFYRIEIVELIATQITTRFKRFLYLSLFLQKAPPSSGKEEISIICSRLSSQIRAETFLPPTTSPSTARLFLLWKASKKGLLPPFLASPLSLSSAFSIHDTLERRSASTLLFGRERNVSPWFFRQREEGREGEGRGRARLRVQTSNSRGRPFTLRKKRWKLAVQSSRPTHLPRDWPGKVLGDSFTLQIGGWNRHQKTFSLARVFFHSSLSRVVTPLFFFFLFLPFSLFWDFSSLSAR